jgi:hypothetical protein
MTTTDSTTTTSSAAMTEGRQADSARRRQRVLWDWSEPGRATDRPVLRWSSIPAAAVSPTVTSRAVGTARCLR